MSPSTFSTYLHPITNSAHHFLPPADHHKENHPFLTQSERYPTMNQVATILGIQLPAMKARGAIQKDPALSSSVSILPHQDSLLLLNLNKHKNMDDDDDTVSTMLSSCSSLGLGVTFADPVVTEVHTRPYTARLEKRALYYCEQDYLEFKRDYFYGSSRDTLVKFTETVVSHVWTVPRHEEASEMYYTEAELQRFLDEFVASLDKGSGMD